MFTLHFHLILYPQISLPSLPFFAIIHFFFLFFFQGSAKAGFARVIYFLLGD